jgi:hypothetical protein
VRPEWWPEWDSAIYILLGRSLARGEGYLYLGEPFSLRPPGLPWLVSWVLPEGELDELALNRLVMFFAGATPTAVYFALRARHPRWLSLAAAMLGATSAIYTTRFNRVESEFPFAALLFLGIGCFERARQAAWRSALWSLSSALCLAGAAHVRTLGLIAIPGLFALALRPAPAARRGSRWLPGLAATVLVLPWLAWARLAAGEAPGSTDQLLASDYWTALTRVDPGDPASPWLSAEGWVRRVRANAPALRALVEATLGSGGGWGGGLLVAGVLAGFALSLRRPSLLEWFAGCYAALLLGSGVHDRLGLPLVHPVALYLLVGARGIAGWLGRRGLPGAELVPGLLVAALAALQLAQWPPDPPTRVQVVNGVRVERSWDLERRLARRIRERTPPDAVILADDAPVFSLLTGRRVYTFRHPRLGNLMERYDPDLVVVDASRYSIPRFEEELARRSQRRWQVSERLSRGRLRVYEPAAPSGG